MVTVEGETMSERRQVKLSEAQARYIEQHASLSEELRAALGRPVQRTLKLTKGDKDQLLGVLGAILQREGFDEAYDATKDGLMLESIIDALSSATG